MRPDVVLYDDPTQGLDPSNTTRVDRVISLLAAQLGSTSVGVTYNLTTAFARADRIAFMNDGVIAEVGPPEQLRASGDPFMREFLSPATSSYSEDVREPSAATLTPGAPCGTA